MLKLCVSENIHTKELKISTIVSQGWHILKQSELFLSPSHLSREFVNLRLLQAETTELSRLWGKTLNSLSVSKVTDALFNLISILISVSTRTIKMQQNKTPENTKKIRKMESTLTGR